MVKTIQYESAETTSPPLIVPVARQVGPLIDSLTKRTEPSPSMTLNGLEKLSSLDRSFTPITNAGLRHLKGLTKLSDLNLQGTRVTGAGVQELQQALPSLRISR
jgi:hypothetical protein